MVAELCAREKCSFRQVNMTISLAFLLAPHLVKAAVEGRLPWALFVLGTHSLNGHVPGDMELLAVRTSGHSRPRPC